MTSTTYSPLQIGQRYLVFLAHNQSWGSYTPVGGPQGVYQITDDRVFWFDGTDEGMPSWLRGQSADGVTASIEQALR